MQYACDNARFIVIMYFTVIKNSNECSRHWLWHKREHMPRYRFTRATKELEVCHLHSLLQSNARRNASLVRQEKERECSVGEWQVAPSTTRTRKHVHHCHRFFTPSSDWFPRVNHRVYFTALLEVRVQVYGCPTEPRQCNRSYLCGNDTIYRKIFINVT